MTGRCSLSEGEVCPLGLLFVSHHPTGQVNQHPMDSQGTCHVRRVANTSHDIGNAVKDTKRLTFVTFVEPQGLKGSLCEGPRFFPMVR